MPTHIYIISARGYPLMLLEDAGPKKAACKYSFRFRIPEGKVVTAQKLGAKPRRYRVGAHPRSLEPLGMRVPA